MGVRGGRRKTKRDDCITIPMRGLMREDVPVEAGGVKPPPSYYDMVGWTEHLGSDAEGGHYIAHCKHLDGHFYKSVPRSRSHAVVLGCWFVLALCLADIACV